MSGRCAARNRTNKGWKMNNEKPKKTGLELLREPFEKHHISKLPKPTKQQTEEVRADFNKGTRCLVCGGWHHPKVVHLDYVGHAALTDRLLESDIDWNWEPLSLQDGLPKFDSSGGLWIKLTVCGVSRLGYGHAETKSYSDAGSREKEVIGDALRNAGMRFGAALELWHKGDLHLDDEKPKEPEQKKKFVPTKEKIETDKNVASPEIAKQAEPKIEPPDIAPGDYIITFGKFKNMQIKDVPQAELVGYINFLEDGALKTNKQLLGGPLSFVTNGNLHLTELGETINF